MSIAWITGASSGIGEALAKAHLDAGGHCILSGRNIAELERVAEESGTSERTLILPFDVSDMDALPSIVEQAIAYKGSIDILVNNAGISQRSLAKDTQFSVYDKVIEVDLLAPIALTQLMLNHFLEKKSGSIIMISSVAGKIGVPLRTAYCAAKHGLIGYADALRSEVAGDGLSVLVVTPGSVRTNVSINAVTADGSARGKSDKAIDEGLEPSFVADEIWSALINGKREIVLAQGMEAEMPKLKASDPDKLFDMIEAMVASGYVEKMD